MSQSFNVNMEFYSVSSQDEFFVKFLDWVTIRAEEAVHHQDTFSSCNSLSNWSYRLLNNNFDGFLHRSSHDWLSIHKIDSFLRAWTKTVAFIDEYGLSEFIHNCTKLNSLLSSDKNAFVDVLESKGTTLVKPNLEVSRMRKQSTFVFAVSINVESTSHTLFKSLVECEEEW